MREPSCRSALVVGALLTVFVLSGCTGGVDDAGDEKEEADPGQPPGEYVEGIGPDFVVLMNPIHGTGCRFVEAVLEVPRSHASSLLPEGFVPDPGPSGLNAALSLEMHACERSQAEEAEGGYARAWLAVHVERPELPGPAAGFESGNRTSPDDAQEAIDLYVVAAYTDGQGFQRFLRQSGIPYELAWVDMELERLEDVLLVQAQVEARDSGEEALRLAAPLALSERTSQHRTAWASTRHGVQAFEELYEGVDGGEISIHEATGVCVAREGLFVQPLGPQGCAAPQVRASQGFQVTGHSLWFHDTRVLE